VRLWVELESLAVGHRDAASKKSGEEAVRMKEPRPKRSVWEGGTGVLAGNLRERPRRPATEQSEGALLGAPPERPLLPKRIPAPPDRRDDPNEPTRA